MELSRETLPKCSSANVSWRNKNCILKNGLAPWARDVVKWPPVKYFQLFKICVPAKIAKRNDWVWGQTRDVGTCRIDEQRRLRRACAYAQPRQSLHLSHIQSMKVEEGPDLIVDV